MSWFTFRRLSVLVAVLAFGYTLTKIVLPFSDLISIADGLEFFLGTVMLVVSMKSTSRFFTERPLKLSRLLSLAVSFFAVSFMAAAVWAVRWKASDYDDALNTDALRFMAKFLALCGMLCAIGAPELFEQRVDKNRLSKLGLAFSCIVLTVLAMIYGARIKSYVNHDEAPRVSSPALPETGP